MQAENELNEINMQWNQQSTRQSDIMKDVL